MFSDVHTNEGTPMSLNDLIAQRDELARQQAELSKAIADAQSAARATVIAQIRSLMADHGLTANDLVTTTSSRKSNKGAGHGNAGSKVAPKYRNQATGETWSGRGLKPKWLRAAIEAGRSIDEFTI
jgi:DNA-binding protein H-NS